MAALLQQIAPPKAPEGSVEVVSWVERNGDTPELVVTLVPKGPGQARGRPWGDRDPRRRATGVAWTGAAPGEPRSSAGAGLFRRPADHSGPIRRRDGKPVEADVEYAYCLVDYQCLFGEAKVSAPTQAPSG